MPYSSPPLDGGRDNVSSTIDGEASGVSYGASNNQNNTALVTRVKKENVQLLIPMIMMRRSPIIKINYTVPMMMINLAVIIYPRSQNRRLVI